MAKKIRFPLKLAEGAEVRTLDELREHFDLQAVLEYYTSGKLLTWLEDRYLEGEAEAIRALNDAAPDFQQRLCEVFQVEYTGAGVDMEEIERRQERLKRLRTITDEAEYIQNIDSVAFDQEELADLLDEDITRIYLCGEKFTVPASRKGVTYVGIKNPAVHISGTVPKTMDDLEIEFQDVTCDNLPRSIVLTEVTQNMNTADSLPRSIVSTEVTQNVNTSGKFDSKLDELFKEISAYDVKYATQNYILFHRMHRKSYGFGLSFGFSGEKKICRLDLRTLEEIQVPETDRLNWFQNAYSLVTLGDKLVSKNTYSGKIMCLNLENLEYEYLADASCLFDVSDQFVLYRYGYHDSDLLIRNSGKVLELHQEYKKIVGNWIYTVENSPNNYRYNPLTGQKEQVQWAGWDFKTEKICGNYIYGIVGNSLTGQDLILVNQATGKKKNLLHLHDKSNSLIKSSCMYQDYWILADQHMPHDPVTIYSVNLKTAVVQKIAQFEEDSSQPLYKVQDSDLIGIIGKYFYYAANNGKKLCKIAIDSPGQVIELT